MASLIPYFPLIAIVGPIAGALIGAAITYFFVVKRKRVTFYISPTEDLMQGLRQHLATAVLRLDNRDVLELNRATVTVKNNGNASIKEFDLSSTFSYNMIYIRRGAVFNPVVLHGSLFELFKCLFHILAVVDFRVVVANGESIVFDEHGI